MPTAAQQQRMAAVVHGWDGRGVLIVGDAMLDEWRFADSNRLCREAPAPVLTLRRRLVAAGGAANTAVNLAALGGRAALVAPVGTDVAADDLHDCLDRAGVWDRTVSQPGRPTPIKRRLLAGNQILVREDEGDADCRLTGEVIGELLGALARAAAELRARTRTDPALVICDYGLGALPEPVRAWLVRHRDMFATVALDAHDLTDWRALAPTVVTPSFAEATRLLDGAAPGSAGVPVVVPAELAAGPTSPAVPPTGSAALDGSPLDGSTPLDGSPLDGVGEIELTGDEIGAADHDIVAAGLDLGADRAELARVRLPELRARTGADVVAVTLDVDGAVVGGADGQHGRSHATPVPPSHTVGAGDAYLAAMTLALAAGAPLPTAAQLAQLAATITVSETGTCVCVREELLAALGVAGGVGDGPAVPVPGLVDPAGLAALVDRHRDAGRTIVFTNGCFDVLHRGHVRYLQQARALGDVLIVAVNADDSVRRLKGPDRPVNPIEDRVSVLTALACVDHVVTFAEDSPGALIELVRPDVYVKGGDYPPELVPEAPLVHDLGGEVRTLGYVPDRSTSAIIDRIRAHGLARDPSAASEDRGQFLSGERR
ncbi:D-glycero-beta-D-manno-heptose 1-phosphate adenylyltransferase [Plantactinospora sp. KBS50]|uniref:D-glycero-beta-D-manno-heptose 1-phosphate adenylyltransferase n=1 Tax=Plantactinospora sp. KBS50 TaxID=2024580 RepID=UPI000BAAF7C2|nr:D-glycero-beta-D-manno-heptose 1-phosphate adenylyltransferase [Plantactinospora sp. KBS50]ASW57374.1 D-glycero-beta-D-manno-heptose 1-phosphate adenylyltransferase [Plantactinospora sp. KBS50]